MKKLFCLCAALSVFAFSVNAFADEVSSPRPQASKRGVYLSFIGFAGGELSTAKRATIGGGARLGGGITEDIMLYAEVRPVVLIQSGINQMLFLDSEVKGQYYFWRGWYANVGAGIATVMHTMPTYPSVNQMYKTGFAGSVGSGYEFRIERRLFLAPEIRAGFMRVGGLNFVTVEGGGSIGFHF